MRGKLSMNNVALYCIITVILAVVSGIGGAILQGINKYNSDTQCGRSKFNWLPLSVILYVFAGIMLFLWIVSIACMIELNI